MVQSHGPRCQPPPVAGQPGHRPGLFHGGGVPPATPLKRPNPVQRRRAVQLTAPRTGTILTRELSNHTAPAVPSAFCSDCSAPIPKKGGYRHSCPRVNSGCGTNKHRTNFSSSSVPTPDISSPGRPSDALSTVGSGSGGPSLPSAAARPNRLPAAGRAGWAAGRPVYGSRAAARSGTRAYRAERRRAEHRR